MIQIKFKNLTKSEIARDAVFSRVKQIIQKFPDLAKSKIQVTLEMVNSPSQSGLDAFKVKLHILSGRYSGITVEKQEPSLYVALAEVVGHMLEVLNRFGDKARIIKRKNARLAIKLDSLKDAVNTEVLSHTQ